jgi:ribosomal protein L34
VSENDAIDGFLIFMTRMASEGGRQCRKVRQRKGQRTLNVYAHLMNPTNPESAEGLEEMVLGNGSKMVAAKEKGSTSVG